MTDVVRPKFDLWTDPWIGLEDAYGKIEYAGIGNALIRAHEFRSIFEISPLVVVGIHRLLTTILQQVFSPLNEADLKRLWQLPQISPDLLREFYAKFHVRFDLFSLEKPFFQSADVSPVPLKGDNIKSVAYLAPDIPSGTEHTHYRHGAQEDQIFCPVCLAGGMVSLPAFSTSGGAGIKPSINGVPPTYVIPCGKTLLESLLLSLVIPAYQPAARSTDPDLVWWAREPVIPRSAEIHQVGYLHSLTFQPRRVRLYPEKLDGTCTRCGHTMTVGVRRMIFDMGESRSKDAPAWFDPFAAYKISETKAPIPIRPVEGKAVWREYASLFLRKKLDQPVPGKKKVDRTMRPSFLDQIADLREGDISAISLRCVGMRTDMNAKIFEWTDTGFEVPGSLLRDEEAAYLVDKGLRFAGDCAGTISSVFRKSFGGSGKDAARYASQKTAMMEDYWKHLALPFRAFITSISSSRDLSATYTGWVDQVTKTAETAFCTAAETLGDQGDQLHKRFNGERLCRMYLFASRKKELNHDG